ncbi:MAG: glutathione S-transferase N-terminal domain-containing protein [Proteobacteria bacterium]|nr:glutathione S-transferase N-terminal domain-containing protein [Pseudomonadota bacterium]
MIDLYYWPTPNGWKISIMLEECGLPYNLKLVNIGQGDQFKPEFLKISPNNRMPAIVDHQADGGPLSIFESGAILTYLAEKTGRFSPTDLRGRYEVAQWLYWQVGGLGPMMGQVSHFVNYAPELTESDISYAKERYWNEGRRLFGVMNTRLVDRDYLAGDYSIADIACWPWVRPWERFGYDLGEFPHLERWFGAVGARPAVVKGCALAEEERKPSGPIDEKTKKILFGQGAPERE